VLQNLPRKIVTSAEDKTESFAVRVVGIFLKLAILGAVFVERKVSERTLPPTTENARQQVVCGHKARYSLDAQDKKRKPTNIDA
jgi:hypothetical protein